jgi:mono/diheme cytochrome c family protein
MTAWALAALLSFSGNGKELYTKYVCYACHTGEKSQGPKLVPMKLTLPAFIAYVRKPRRMPAYSEKVLPDAQLADIYEYLKTGGGSTAP